MIFTVTVVIVNSEAFIDPALDVSATMIRDVFRTAASNHESFEVTTVTFLPQSEDHIRNSMREILENNSVIGFLLWAELDLKI